MADTITRQVSEQVQKAMEAVNASRPLPHFDYMPTTGCEPSHQHTREPYPHHLEKDQEASRSNRSGRPYTGNIDRRAAAATQLSGYPVQDQRAKSTTTSTPYATHSRREVSRFASPHNDPLVVEIKIASAIRHGHHHLGLLEEADPPRTRYCPLGVHHFRLRGAGGASHRPSIILTVLFLRSPSLSIQGVDRFVPRAITLTRKEDKFDLLGVPTLGLGLQALIDIMDVGLEVGVLLKFLSQLLQRVRTALLIALLLGLGRLSAHTIASASAVERAPPAGVADPSSRPPRHLSLPLASPSVIGTGSPTPPAFSAPSQPLALEQKPQP
ncbi:hypothetical protein Cgig2_028596 [Carnegiea gigantea]|uniref:Uncharacterized protein n=1 Tax=Carnegiea gigantea TaxID=171969 RepID=A0A9Q1K796_9CARY|nr:hypothetical protein Cgig2_028596 [Carnegiea gigantea]